MDVLICTLKAQQEESVFMDYIGTCAGMAVRLLAGFGGNKLDFPNYIELAHPDRKEPEDTRSGNEIIEGLRERLKGGG